MFVSKHEACLLLLFLREYIIKYNYNIIHINTELIQKYKKFPSHLMHVMGGASKL